MADSVKQMDDVDERSRRYGIRDGACQAVMQGGGENYLSAFALLLHASPFQIGLLSALPQLIGTWAQLFSLKILQHAGRRKSLILAGAIGQTILWLPLLALPLLFPDQGAWLLITCTIVYVAMGQFAIPAWNSLITDFVDPDQRGIYFGRRARLMAITSFAVLGAAGLVLHFSELWHQPWMGFAIIFTIAAVARGVSTLYLSLIDETLAPPTCETEFKLFEFLRNHRGSNFQRFLMFSGLMHLAVLIAGPYLLVYMLRDLHFTYAMYAAWMASGVLGQFLTLKPWGRLGDRFGNKNVLVTSGLLVPFLPMVYIVSSNFYFLVAANFFAGVVWAGLSMGLQNYLFDSVHIEDRAKSVAVWNTVNAIGWCLGALLGGWLATVAPSEIRLWGIKLELISNLPVVFLISGLLRLVVSVGFLRSLRESRNVELISFGDLCLELPLVKPLTGAFIQGTRQVAVVREVAPQWLSALTARSTTHVLRARGRWRRRHRGGKWNASHSGEVL